MEGEKKKAGGPGTARCRSNTAVIALVSLAPHMCQNGYWKSWQSKNINTSRPKTAFRKAKGLERGEPSKTANF